MTDAAAIMARAIHSENHSSVGDHIRQAQAALAALEANGLAIVPVELLERCRDREYNPFELDNQTKLHDDICAMFAAAKGKE